ncbi:Serine/threonine-protein kinase SMG1 [Choanephora cucurbitarum]|uniref:non-specific serine/threonine protein kinase n=1 Tax=Choanephora cucurbitarum TaxID=101091 RepID=A0A1C7NAZ0_9FUNG|nr:Serine/threonine-protein kinase SMG1 [Choanephora cucurbitarum]
MTSKRNNNYGNSGNHNSRNNTRGAPRERVQRQHHKPNTSSNHSNAINNNASNAVNNSNDSRVVQLLRRIFSDEDDSSFTRRVADATQLQKQLEDARSTISDSLELRQEQMQLLDICIHDGGLQRMIEFPKAPTSLKNNLIRIVSGLACYTRLDLALSWIFDRLAYWPTSANDIQRDGEWKKWLLRLLKQVLTESAENQYTYKQTMEMSPMILAGVTSFLDMMDSSDYLPIVVDILLYFSEHYQPLFAQRFKDIIDLFVGWNMDPELPDQKRAIILESYTKFGIYWVNCLPFAIELLTHFLSDIKNTAQELATASQENYKVKWKNIIGIFECFHVILEAISPFLMSSNTSYQTQQYFQIAIEELLVGVLSIARISKGQEWLHTSSAIILKLAAFNPAQYRSYQYPIYLLLVEHEIENAQLFVDTLIRFLSLWNHDVDEKIVYHLLNPQVSPVFVLHRRVGDNEVRLKRGIHALIKFLVGIPISHSMQSQVNELCIQQSLQFSKYTTDEVHTAFQRLSLLFKQHSQLLNNVKKEEMTSKEDVLFSIFVILSISSAWPDCSFINMLTIAFLLSQFWETKSIDMFDSCFDLLKDHWNSRLDYMIDYEKQTLELVVIIMTDLLDCWAKLSLCTKEFIHQFTKNLLTALYNQQNIRINATVTFKPIITGFLHAVGVEKNSQMNQKLLCIVAQYCQMFGSADIVELALEHAQISINSPHTGIQDASKDLLVSLNPFVIAQIKAPNDPIITSIQNIIMASPHTGSFRPVHYEIAMKHLGMASHLIGSEEQKKSIRFIDPISLDWTNRLIHFCDTPGNLKSVSALVESEHEIKIDDIIDRISNSKPLLHYWVVWESARYCILSRLRTPFGGPQQTFAAFERMLQSLVFTVGSDKKSKENVESLRCLLLLIDRLELQISNAIDGCATGTLPAVPRPSLIFFRTNKKTCHDYFLRIRPNVIAGAKIIDNKHILIYHTQQLLKEMELNIPNIESISTWFKDVNKYLRDLVEACIQEKYMDLIYGLQSWYKRLIRKVGQTIPDFAEKWCFEGLIGPNIKNNENESTKATTTWFQVAALFASGRDEIAIKSLAALRSVIQLDDFGILNMLTQYAVQFYTSLQDYDALQRIIDSGYTVIDAFICDSLRSFDYQNNTSCQPIVAAAELDNFIKTAPLSSCLQLAQLDQFRSMITEESSIDHHLSERILQTLKENLFTSTSSLLELELLETNWYDLMASAKSWLELNTNENRHSYVPLNTKLWARLSTHFEYMSGPFSADSEASSLLSLIQLHSAKIARCQGNIHLAQTLADKAVRHPDTKHLAFYEQTKISFLQSHYTDAMKIASDILVQLDEVEGSEELKSKTYLKIARYLKNCPDEEVNNLVSQLDPKVIKMDSNELHSSAELCINDALEKSIENNTGDGRPWFEYATHFYKQGWRILDELLRPDSAMPIVLWVNKKLCDALGISGDEALVRKGLFGLFLKYSPSFNSEESSFEAFASELQQVVPDLDSSKKVAVMETIKTLHNTIVDKFRSSAEAYFRYLSLDIHTQKHEDHSQISSTSMVVTATLRLLRILTKYGDSLQTLFNHHVENVCVSLWKPIIPQLFAQLNHPNDFVRLVISKIIRRICDEYPREIIYDVIVNSTSTKTNHNTKQSLLNIANRMMDRNNLLWVSTSRMVEELEKITVLWEERWLNRIASLQQDVMQQFAKLDQEAERLLKKDDTAQQEKSFLEIYESLMKFVVSAIDKLYAETMQQNNDVLTPHERHFQQTYGMQLTQAYHLLQKPTCIKEYRHGWEFFQKLHRRLMAETHKFRVLELGEVSPYLFNMKNTPIGIPGRVESNTTCFINSFGSSVIILPTKTKPKKLDLRGTDGEKYPYLFKGLEDLHLDERIMQLLTTTNGLLRENGATALRGMCARTYAVIPLSDHSGMIQWVNEATPLFALYKRWQKRESAAHMLLAGENNKPNEAYMQNLMQRPTENFTTKMASALRAAGLRVTANRRYWPKEILRKVFLDLVKETPGDLLEKELYYTSSSATEWYKKSTSFAHSLAVTSMIGYIIGLGDRHLDNMMIDFRSGEVIHIDYNVCFEKGKRLRVPELVPYRLTQNLYGALGITGVDGQFKAAAEETLRVLRKHKEVLITLLDAFVYDPLVDWENGAVEAGYRQMMELQANLSLVATRISEKQTEQEEERKVILSQLDNLKQNLHQWHESVLIETDGLDETSEDEEQVVDQEISAAPTDTENDIYMSRLPMYVLREVQGHLFGVTSLVNNSRSSVEGISPLLESIIIIETDADSELRSAQSNAKIALDSLAIIDTELKKLEAQLKEKSNYESEWSYHQLLEFIEIINKSIQEYFAALKTLEEFGPDNNKSITVTEENKRSEDDVNEESQERINPNQNASQGPHVQRISPNTHVTKIMKRIRHKLEGVDFGVQHKMTVNEQVARSIDQATSVDNLCMMYEGWTSWV